MNHNRKYLNRFLAFVLAAALIVTYMPTSRIAFAEAEATSETQTEASAEEKKAEPAPAPEPPKEEKAEPVAEPEPEPEPEPAKEEASEPAESVDSESATDEQGNEAEVENTEEALPEEEAKEAEEEEEEELKYPAISETATVGNYTVHVSAPEDAFPEGTTISIKGVSSDAIEGQVQGLMGGNTAVVQAADISFIYEGKEKEPANGKKVSVTFSSSELGGLDAPSVVHVKDSGAAEHVSANISGSSASFKAGDFSIYAIVDSGEDARLEVKFVQNGGNVVTAYVKKKDIDEGKLNTIVYDPGAGNISDNQVFLGWTDDSDYTADTKALDIAGIRSAVETEVNGGVTEGQSVTYYAMVFDLYKVTYLKEQGVALGEDKVYVRADANDKKVKYTISKDYTSTDQEHNFEGWLVTEGKNNIEDYEEGHLYKLNEQPVISGDITLSVEEAEGHWLVFDENGKGATYYPPAFVKSDELPTDPVTSERPMVRNGYSFDGWYDDPEGGSPFNFDEKLTAYTTVYAHWTKTNTAKYTVIIWKQKVTDSLGASDKDKTYDYVKSVIVADAAVDTTPSAVSGTPGSSTATVDGAVYGDEWQGFYYARTDQSEKKVTPEGDTVVNVYFDRRTVVIDFRTYRGGGGCGNGCNDTSNYSTWKTYSGLFGSTLADNNYKWPGEYMWTDKPDGEGTKLTFLDAFIPADWSKVTYKDGNIVITLYGGDPQGDDATIEFYKQSADDPNEYELANTVKTQGDYNYHGRVYRATFNITDKYSGYTAYQYSNDGGITWHDVGERDPETGDYGDPVRVNKILKIRFNRVAANLSFRNGSYYKGGVKGEDGTVKDVYEGPAPEGDVKDEVTGLTYGENISEYASAKPDKTESGYVFGGWYTDKTCTQEYTFTTIPEAGAVVYAKWIKTQYRVFLHPNAEDADFGTGQEMNFRVDIGDKVGTVTGIRKGYTFVGWYFDEGFTKPFKADAYVLNDTTVTTPYTDKLPEDVSRFWITKKLDLYAKWSAKLDGADGITVAYDAEDVKDTNLYVDGAEAITASATKKAPAGKKFDHWELTHKSGLIQKLYPGNHFIVYKEDAVEEIIEKDEDGKIIKATYTVTLVPKYVDAEEETQTTITYDPNGGTGTAITENVKINDKLTAKPANTFTRKGYTFKEWNTMADGSGDSFRAGANIAADLLDRKATNTSANTLYAQWDAIKYTVKYVDGVDGEVVFADQTTENRTVEDDVPPFIGTPSRTGYEFQGWDKKNTGKVDPDLADENNVITYTAIWKDAIKEVSVRINGNSVEKVYNGAYQDGEPYTLTWFVDGVEAEKPAEVEFVQDGAAYPNGKNVKTYNASITGTIRINDTTKYKLPADGGVSTDETYKGITHLVIKPAPLTVTVTGNTDTVTYNGKQHSVTGFTHEVTGLQGTDDKSLVTVNGAAAASGTDVGTYPMNLTADKFSATLPYGNNNYTITVEIAENGDGWLRINPAAITINITGNKAEKTYNGAVQTAEDYTAECDSNLFSKDKIVITGTAKAEGTDADTYKMGLTPSQFSYNDENVTATFSVSDGELKINPAAVTISTGSGNKTYDGSALTNSEASITGLVGGDSATVTATGSQTNVGSSRNTYTIDWGNTNEANYTVTERLGTLTVTAAGGGDNPDDGDNPGGGNNPGGGDGNPAVAPAAAPAPAAAAIPDAPVPQAEPATDIPDEPTPLAEGVWALANLIMAIVTALGAVVALFRKKEEEDEDNMDKEENEDDNRSKKMLAAKIAGVLAGIAGPVVFLLTEDMSLPMAMFDKWTVLMAVILATQVVAAIFNKKASELEEDEDGNAEGATN